MMIDAGWAVVLAMLGIALCGGVFGYGRLSSRQDALEDWVRRQEKKLDRIIDLLLESGGEAGD